MNEDVITKVLGLFDEEDIPFIKASKFLEYKKEKESKSFVKRLVNDNESKKSKMGRIFLSK